MFLCTPNTSPLSFTATPVLVFISFPALKFRTNHFYHDFCISNGQCNVLGSGPRPLPLSFARVESLSFFSLPWKSLQIPIYPGAGPVKLSTYHRFFRNLPGCGLAATNLGPSLSKTTPQFYFVRFWATNLEIFG